MILFKSKAHKLYLSMITKHDIPNHSADAARVTFAYFAISGLDILNGLELIEDKKNNYIDWLYYLLSTNENVGGFQNSATFNNTKYQWGHIAATYSALNTLLILGDDLSRIDKKALLQSMRKLQLDDGSFQGAICGAENDMRFIYCAASICYILDDFSGMDIDKAVDYILESISYDGAIGQGPETESHGGSTFCAVATLALTGNLKKLTKNKRDNLIRWILSRQNDGFQGRPNKITDTCYTFWLGATLKILDSYDLVNKERLENFVMAAQDFQTGGFSKWNGCRADPLHTYFSLAGLSIMKIEGLNEIMPMLNITYKTYKHLKTLHECWRI